VGERAVVVGGGAIGVACAHHLAQAGFDVTILERGEIAGGCSFANAGLIVPGYSHALPAPGVIREGFRHLMRRDGPFTIRPRPDPELARWLFTFRRSCAPELFRRATGALTELSRLSLELFEVLESDGEVDFGYQRGALLNVYMSDGWQGRALATCDELHDLGFDARPLDQDEVLELEPALSPAVRGALLIEDQASGDCFAYVRSLADGLAHRGVQIRTGTPSERVLLRGGRATGVLTASGEEVPAELVVLAAGAWTPSLTAPLGFHLPIQPATGYSCTIPAWEGAPSSPIMLDESHVVVLPLGDRVRFAGTLELAGFRTAPDARRYEAVVRAGRAAMRIAPPDEGEAWFGFRPLMPDDLPAIGWVPDVDGVIVAAGHGTLGFTQSPGTGKLVAELASGTPPSVSLEPFRLDRF
jgi:D-amino-acid dehydrogenase